MSGFGQNRDGSGAFRAGSVRYVSRPAYFFDTGRPWRTLVSDTFPLSAANLSSCCGCIQYSSKVLAASTCLLDALMLKALLGEANRNVSRSVVPGKTATE